MFFVGSRDESAGNQLCQLECADDGHDRLEIRVSDRLRSEADEMYLVVAHVAFDFDTVALDAALDAGTALSWRLHRDERCWCAFVSINHQPAPSTTLKAQFGTISDDFNVGRLVATETDAFGNLLRTRRLPPLREVAPSDQRHAALSDTLSVVVAWAKETRKAIVAEHLDFTAQKKATAQLSSQGARLCSRLALRKKPAAA
ncbi:hypothetical protein [Candidatus Burkholderia verschuerenii]|uniref:hypothetical protein n=1 Tax=Candidatus Burkholderia verschuerenii TaxID=242163 RepID=UPI00067CB565|nr:hypothetical protein [Candidatus Burkholderia verschuerenii]